uniref:Uncharacterized protein LOC111121662 isoform X1 n=1 Tax=Crassostrea virginica TaxID=6565 RepID=A0A8B8CSM8_CRAVI|nr:uncharacterized protein LOC111121662 isoform X1 [Crassostrea virginica]
MEVDVVDNYDWFENSLVHLPAGVLYEIFKHLDWMDLCRLAQTCTKFQELVQKATIWMQMKTLDFTYSPLPLAERILSIIKRCPNAEYIRIGEIVLEDTLDLFLASVFRCCPHLKKLFINTPSIDNDSVEILHQKGDNLKYLSVNLFDEYLDSQHLTQVIALKNLQELHLQQCRSNVFVHRLEDNPTYNIIKLVLNDSNLREENITEILRSCIHLEYLDLQNSISSFPTSNLPVKNGLNKLRVLNLGQNDIQNLEAAELFPCLETLNVDMCQMLESIEVSAPLLFNFSCNACDALKKLELSPCSINSIHLRSEMLQSMQINSSSLQEVELSCNKRLSAESLMAAIPHKDLIQIVTLNKCEGISANDLNEILTEFPNLRELNVTVGETKVPWNQAQIKSEKLRTLQFGGCTILSSLPISAPALHSLSIQDCRDFEEIELLDALLYGKKITLHLQIERVRGMECLWNRVVDQRIFDNQSGVENLQELYLTDMKGIKGTILSSAICNFKFLHKLVLKGCNFLSQLPLKNCSSIEVLCIESCPKFSLLAISDCPNLHILHVKYCSMMHQCSIEANQLTETDLTGTNFSNFSLSSAELGHLTVHGVCTRESNTLNLSCPLLESISIQKCDMLTDETVADVFARCPKLTSLTILGGHQIRHLEIPRLLEVLSLTGLRKLQQVNVTDPSQLQHLTLNNLPKFSPELRMALLKKCERTLEVLEVRAIPGEVNLSLELTSLKSLTLDQGIHLSDLYIKCPKLTALRVQGCPKLTFLEIDIETLSQIQIHHSARLMGLRHMTIKIPSTRHLSNILAYYAPNLQTLTIENSWISKEELMKLGRSLMCLGNINLKNCKEENQFAGTFKPMLLGRSNNIPLKISRL